MGDDELFEGENWTRVDEERGPVEMDEPKAKGEARVARERPLPLNYLHASPTRRTLIDFFLTVADDDETFSNSALARETDLGRRTVIEHIPVLQHCGVVRNDGSENRPQWTLDTESPVVAMLYDANQLVGAHYSED